MKKAILLILFASLLYACKAPTRPGSIEETHDIGFTPRHPDFESFKVGYVSELGDANWDFFKEKINKQECYINTLKHTTTFSVPVEVNTCATYSAGVDISGDTLFLKYEDIGNIQCTSHSIHFLHYEIKNHALIDYVIIFEGKVLKEGEFRTVRPQ